MFGILWRFLGNFLIWACLGSLITVFLSLGLLLRLLPTFFRFIKNLIRALLILSFRLYFIFLSALAPSIEKEFGINLLEGFWRLIACLGISCSLGLVGAVMVAMANPAHTHWGLWIMGLSFLHGLVVALVWDDIIKPFGLQLGERIK